MLPLVAIVASLFFDCVPHCVGKECGLQCWSEIQPYAALYSPMGGHVGFDPRFEPHNRWCNFLHVRDIVHNWSQNTVAIDKPFFYYLKASKTFKK